jgi:hypothetical protein
VTLAKVTVLLKMFFRSWLWFSFSPRAARKMRSADRSDSEAIQGASRTIRVSAWTRPRRRLLGITGRT